MLWNLVNRIFNLRMTAVCSEEFLTPISKSWSRYQFHKYFTLSLMTLIMINHLQYNQAPCFMCHIFVNYEMRKKPGVQGAVHFFLIKILKKNKMSELQIFSNYASTWDTFKTWNTRINMSIPLHILTCKKWITLHISRSWCKFS